MAWEQVGLPLVEAESPHLRTALDQVAVEQIGLPLVEDLGSDVGFVRHVRRVVDPLCHGLGHGSQRLTVFVGCPWSLHCSNLLLRLLVGNRVSEVFRGLEVRGNGKEDRIGSGMCVAIRERVMGGWGIWPLAAAEGRRF